MDDESAEELPQPGETYLVYFDEVKPHGDAQPYFWVAGIVVPMKLVPELEEQVSALSLACFGDAGLSRATEFHAAKIYHRKDNFKSWPDRAKRIEVLCKLAKIIDRPSVIGKVYACIDPRLMTSDTANDNLYAHAFHHFTERVNTYLFKVDGKGLLIGDLDTAAITERSAAALSEYRRTGTPYQFGHRLGRFVDTVHFSPSHLSRMLQLADVHAWLRQYFRGTRSLDSDLARFVREETDLMWADRRKEWPTSQSWSKKS